MKLTIFICALLFACTSMAQQVPVQKIAVIAYYAGDTNHVRNYPVEKLTHIIFSFCHLSGNEIKVSNKKDTLVIKEMIAMKQRNPSLKVILSLGGWGGCEMCSPVFATAKGRRVFARSVKKLNNYFTTDGIDLDWEYPALEGFPGHAYLAADKHNFTLLIEKLRKKLGPKHEISFAAGGFTKFLQESVEWEKVAPLVDKINLMTYDLVHGFSTVTGHHTPLYSTPSFLESTDHTVKYLDSIGVNKKKIVIGAAMYARIFDAESDANNGLYQKGKFNKGISFKHLDKDSLQMAGFASYWDDVAKAPYMYSPAKKQMITFDDERSMILKTKYALENNLGGIMFWQLDDDKPVNGLLTAIDSALH